MISPEYEPISKPWYEGLEALLLDVKRDLNYLITQSENNHEGSNKNEQATKVISN
jgi:hypothetical protein